MKRILILTTNKQLAAQLAQLCELLTYSARQVMTMPEAVLHVSSADLLIVGELDRIFDTLFGDESKH